MSHSIRRETAKEDVFVDFGSRQAAIEQGVSSPTEQQCFIAIAIVDSNRNNIMERPEYLDFVNRLGGQNWALASDFDDLPLKLKERYLAIAGTGDSIDIAGGIPGQNPDESQRENLLDVCYSVFETVSELLSPTLSPSQLSASPSGIRTTDSPSLGPTRPPAGPISIEQCFDLMIGSDENGNNFLDKDEYTRFCILMSSNILEANTFGELETGLRVIYFSLEENVNGVSIGGVRSGPEATISRIVYLADICRSVSEEVDIAASLPTIPSAARPTFRPSVQPTTQPSISPTGSSAFPSLSSVPSIAPSNVTSFVPSSLQPASPELRGVTTSTSSLDTTWVVVIASGAGVLAALLCCLGGYFFYQGQRNRQVGHHNDDRSKEASSNLFEDESFGGKVSRTNVEEEKEEEKSTPLTLRDQHATMSPF